MVKQMAVKQNDTFSSEHKRARIKEEEDERKKK
jgi:hypothetical protein